MTAPGQITEAASMMGVCLDRQRLEREALVGYWEDRVLTEFVDGEAGADPDKTALVAHRSDTGREDLLSFADLSGRSRRIAANLARLGIRHGDVVSFQLPNWWQFAALHLACLRVGAISNPLMPIFRARELEFMVGFANTKIFVVPSSFNRFDHLSLALELQRKLPNLKHALAIGGQGNNSFEEQLLEKHQEDWPIEATRARPNDVAQLLYTSGTTGQPKGVMHTSNTLIASARQLAGRMQLTDNDVAFMPAPMAHQLGFCLGMTMAAMLGCPLVTGDIWSPSLAARMITRHRVTYACGSTPFLSDLADVEDDPEVDFSSLRVFLTSGAPVQAAIVDRARDRLGLTVLPGWGMTEVVQATSTLLSDSPADPLSDGVAIPGSEVRIVDEDGRPVGPAEIGRLQYRGSALCVGYYRRPDLFQLADGQWFETGDLARLDAKGYVRIVGRNKDIIIRGGENIPVVEVEDLLYEMPQVADGALVAMPDHRLGERACAFITVRPGQNLTFEEMISFLEKRRLARQYLPERLEIVDQMPRTPSGKIQKFVLREMAANL